MGEEREGSGEKRGGEQTSGKEGGERIEEGPNPHSHRPHLHSQHKSFQLQLHQFLGQGEEEVQTRSQQVILILLHANKDLGNNSRNYTNSFQ